jgi:hypothetical protein
MLYPFSLPFKTDRYIGNILVVKQYRYQALTTQIPGDNQIANNKNINKNGKIYFNQLFPSLLLAYI